MRLVAENLTVLRGPRTVIANLSFMVESGETLVLTGPNGSGKTTLIRTLAGFLKPASGLVRFEGGDPDRSIGEQCHYVGHQNGVKGGLTAVGNLNFWARYLADGARPASPEGRVGDALRSLGLEALAPIPAGYLSAGQRRRLGLARLLMVPRPIWLLDEPTVSLDAASTALVAELLREHVAGRGVLVAATHLPLGIEGATYLRLGERAEAA